MYTFDKLDLINSKHLQLSLYFHAFTCFSTFICIIRHICYLIISFFVYLLFY